MTDDPCMKRAREVFRKSKLTFAELGAKMGYRTSQSQAAWNFLRMVHDPRLSVLRRFARAVGCKVTDLLEEP